MIHCANQTPVAWCMIGKIAYQMNSTRAVGIHFYQCLYILWYVKLFCLPVEDDYLVQFEYIDYCILTDFALPFSGIGKWTMGEIWQEIFRKKAMTQQWSWWWLIERMTSIIIPTKMLTLYCGEQLQTVVCKSLKFVWCGIMTLHRSTTCETLVSCIVVCTMILSAEKFQQQMLHAWTRPQYKST